MANISKIKRDEMVSKVKEIKTFVLSSEQDENTSHLLTYLGELEEDIKAKKYGLVFEEHIEEIDDILANNTPVFVEDVDKLIDNQTDMNFLIEGDNLSALKLLEKTHKNRLDVIYIDPPYNTGSKDWKYNNDYVVKEDTFRHSKWLSMISKRIRVAKKLLKEDGVFICAIDENELATILLLIEDEFGPDYAIDCITVVHNPRGVQGNNFSYVHEYAIFAYRKRLKVIGNSEVNEEDIDWSPLRNWGTESERHDAANCFYPVLVKDGEIIGFGDDITNTDIHPNQTEYDDETKVYSVYPIDTKGVERKWRYARQTVESIKHLLRVKEIKNGGFDIELGKNFGAYKTVWTDKKFDANEYGSQLINSMVESNDFDFPKSIFNTYECLYAIIKDKPEALVLDFFAGSGTTGHATLMMNKVLSGNRKFILCTNNAIGEKKEKEFAKKYGKPEDFPLEWEEYCNKYGISRSITYPRIRSAINGYIHNKDVKYPIFEKKIMFTDMKNTRLFDKAEQIKASNEDKYDSISIEVDEGSLKVIGVTKKGAPVEGIKASLKYYKVDFVRISERLYYEYADELLKYIKSLVEIENSINFNNNCELAIVLSDDELDTFVESIPEECITIYLGHDVLPTEKQNQLFKERNIKINIIPEYYYKELEG